MNVLEFIRDKKEDFQENTAQFRAMLEPTFQSWSNRLNDHITNTLNNPWIANLNPFESRHLFNSRKVFKNPMVKDMYEDLNKNIGREIYVGEWQKIDQECINQFADVTGDQQWIHTDLERAEKESPFKTTIAHGFLTLSKHADVVYKVNEYWDKSSERSLNWNDKKLDINWPKDYLNETKIELSNKDRSAPFLDEISNEDLF